jgi:hypothetical protein
MSGATPPLPQYALMAWCSVKAQGQLYIYLLPTIIHVYEGSKVNYSVQLASLLKAAIFDKDKVVPVL